MVKIASPRALEVIGTDAEGRNVRMTRGAYQWVYDVWRRLGGDTDAVETAQTTATSAAESTHYGVGNPGNVVVRSDPSGVFSAASVDLTMEFFDPDGIQIASRTLTGTLNTGSGTFTVADNTSSGLSTSYALSGDGTDSVRADVTVTLGSGKQLTAPLSWNAVDQSTGGATPSSGGGK